MFRIDKTRVSYDYSGYTSISTLLGSAYRVSEKEKTTEERLKAQLMEELEKQLQNRIADAEKEAGDILASAEKEAGETLHRAETEAAGIISTAEEKGYRDGEMRAEQEMQKLLEEQVGALRNIVTEAGTVRDELIDGLEDEIITLVIETAQKVINIELEKNDKAFKELVQNALGQMKREGKIIIRVAPEDYASLFCSGSAEFVFDNERIKATVIEEPLFEKGDCVIDSEGETVNAGISSQLRHIEFAFRNEESYAE